MPQCRATFDVPDPIAENGNVGYRRGGNSRHDKSWRPILNLCSLFVLICPDCQSRCPSCPICFYDGAMSNAPHPARSASEADAAESTARILLETQAVLFRPDDPFTF